jgi:hypothetical protein
VKLRGRVQAFDWSSGRILSPRARGDTTELHGPLQRLLERMMEAIPAVGRFPAESRIHRPR